MTGRSGIAPYQLPSTNYQMKNPALNNCILKILARVGCGLKEKTLMDETSLAMDRHDLTTDEFDDALRFLEDKALVEYWDNLIGDTVWGITKMGQDALKGL